MVLEKITERERASARVSVGGEGGSWRGKNQTHPDLFRRQRSHHRCSHRHSVWAVGRGVWRAGMASIGWFLFWTVHALSYMWARA